MENKEPSIISIFWFGQLGGFGTIYGVWTTDNVKDDDIKWLRRIANIGLSNLLVCI